jgi:hypothetical protein
MSKFHGTLQEVRLRRRRRGTILGLALGLAIAAWALLPLPARAQAADLLPGHVLDVCDVAPDDPDCRLLSDEEFAAVVAEPVEPEWPGVPVLRLRQPSASAPLLSLQSRHQMWVRLFSQNDARWKNRLMQKCEETIGASGCTLTAATMVMWYFGSNRNPQAVNECLGEQACPLGWSSLDGCSNGRSHHVGRRNFSYRDLRDLVNSGRPAMVRATNAWGGPHWVVVVGYDDPPDGGSPDQARLFLINDPYDGTLKRLDSYSGYSRIEILNKVGGGPR